MKYKLLIFLPALLLVQSTFIHVYALPPGDTTEIARLSKAVNGISDSLRTLYGMKKDADSSRDKDSANKAVQASFSNARNLWTAHKTEKYKKPFGDFTFILIVAILITLAGGILLGIKSAICKDESYQMDDKGQKVLKDEKDRPYSYSKFQCLWWTCIIFSCYVTACIHLHDLVPLNYTMILLLGGGISVSVFGKIIDNRQINDNNSQLPTRHQDLNKKPCFIIDILSDENGVSVYRLQAFLFNILFGIGFIGLFIAGINAKDYPFADFELWQFSLLGVSAAGYLGLKSGENNTASQPARLAAARNASPSSINQNH